MEGKSNINKFTLIKLYFELMIVKQCFVDVIIYQFVKSFHNIQHSPTLIVHIINYSFLLVAVYKQFHIYSQYKVNVYVNDNKLFRYLTAHPLSNSNVCNSKYKLDSTDDQINVKEIIINLKYCYR